MPKKSTITKKKKKSVAPRKTKMKTKAAPVLKERVKRKVVVDQCDIPLTYNKTRLTLLARDPKWVHAYWEISPASVEKLSKEIGIELNNPSYTLRMYDVTNIDFNGSNAHHWFDIDVGPDASNWYINLWNDNVSYCCEIGIRLHDGRFFAITRSNFITTPRETYSDRTDSIWMEVKDEQYSNRPYVMTQKNVRTGNGKRSIRRKMYLTEEDIRAYYMQLFPLLARVRGRRKGGILSKRLGKGWSLADPRVAGFVQWNKEEFLKKISLGASDEMLLWRHLGEGDFALAGGASEQLFSGASERQEQQRKFFFELGTELIVYGRTEPDAEVWHGDKKINLREDGTFSIRFALPDGKIPLDFVAVSNDKVDKRSITTAVERTKTTYSD